MEQGAEWDAETVTFETSDGVMLEGDLGQPVHHAAASPASTAAIVCHPHPQYGGNRLNNVVDACWRTLVAAGIPSLRFDFRAEFGGGIAERLDAAAALDVVAGSQPGASLAVVGYSFGALVALGLQDTRIAAKVLIAPPLTAMPVEASPQVPTLVLTPAHDQFTPPSEAAPVVDGWRSDAPIIDFDVVEMADHFLVGRTTTVAQRTVEWLTTLPQV